MKKPGFWATDRYPRQIRATRCPWAAEACGEGFEYEYQYEYGYDIIDLVQQIKDGPLKF